MKQTNRIEARFVEFVPADLDPGIVYVSTKYRTAAHLCCCGCGNKVVTPLKPGGWELTRRGSQVTLAPSIGNWSFSCKSHYFIRGNRIVWAGPMSVTAIDAVRRSDQRAREMHFDAPPSRKNLWRRLIDWLFG